jgi:hypothetical protein
MIDECAKTATRNAEQSIKGLISELGDLIEENPNDEKLNFHAQLSVLTACSMILMRGLIAVDLEKDDLLKLSGKTWEAVQEIKQKNDADA